jgi:hypothetical protein
MKGLRFSQESIRGKDLRKVALGFSCIIVLAGVVSAIGIHQHNKQVKASRVNSELVSARKETSKMDREKNDQKRISDLRVLESDFKEYSQKKNQDKEVTDYYAKNISSGRQYFVDRTSKKIQAYTMTKDQLKKINQKDLQTKVDGLNNEREFIEQNKKVVYTTGSYKTFMKSINKLLTPYNKKLLVLNKKAAEDSSKKASSSSSVAAAQASSNSSSTTNNATTSATGQNGSGTSSYTANAGTNNSGYHQTTTSGNSNYSGSTGNTSNYSGNTENSNYNRSTGSTNNYGGGSASTSTTQSNGGGSTQQSTQKSQSNNSGQYETWYDDYGNNKIGVTKDYSDHTTVYDGDGKEMGGFTN